MNQGPLATVSILIFVLLVWLGIGTLRAELAGFNRFAREFPDRKDARPKRVIAFCTADFGNFYRLSGVTAFEVCDEGIRIRVSRVLALFARSAFLPWDRFRTEPVRGPLGRKCEIRWGTSSRDTLHISEKLARKLALASDGAFGAPEQGR